MASFTAPAAPSAPFYIGKGYLGANSVEADIFGYEIPNDLSSTVGSDLDAPYSIVDPMTLFDVSGLTENHEVPAVLYVSPNTISAATTYTFNWYRKRDSKLVFSIVFSLPDPSPSSYDPGSSIAAWIGWLADDLTGVPTYPTYKEIQENGDYYVNIAASGGESFSQDIDFVVEGIPSSTFLDNKVVGGFDWVVRLSSYFDSDNYIRAGVTTDAFTDGQSSEPTGILDYNSAPTSNVGCATNGSISGLTAGTYTLYGFAQSASGDYFQAGSYTIVVSGDFEWDVPKVSGEPVNITALEWNKLSDEINRRRVNHFLGTFPFDTVSAGGKVLHGYFNDAVNAISAMSPTVALPSSKSAGNVITPSDLNGLVDSLNSV